MTPVALGTVRCSFIHVDLWRWTHGKLKDIVCLSVTTSNFTQFIALFSGCVFAPCSYTNRGNWSSNTPVGWPLRHNN